MNAATPSPQSQPTPQPAPRPWSPPGELTRGFWDAAAEHRLVIQRCDECGTWRHYPQERCPQCTSDAWTWQAVSGRGTIYTFTVTHQAFHPYWADRVPYAVATIELDEGVRLVSDLPPTDTDRVAIGAPVEVFFDEETIDGVTVTLARFRLAEPDSAPRG